ncbi:hypothetical protein LPJ78_005412 [Coemansia sp. RSA 989]|nr:hypothetical protein BX667DRAFT_369051 [Coemansia mojavensis]KAJ1738101.1 hypothetical protein LPJ68_005825 [Coemansia sp. RSA 1086]KAJ1747322.1 hypothetical protein LPJ79_005337 [Coemansia sp. RSA 1821]KAJ1861313.1 hypothetical protein LPJ78_005412 [Coemansia sp. RSA 989]KAJ1869369.1 hypothetical protein LPJ55_005395 [Coemansia sp. RSA 990]KAJ2628864.1 hypothetical protein H4R22_003652 [Coemansia sp. RSA 1290]KAJ2652606.1 hypothetical protein IWW40_001093 [Coemansia sp. RSA 1250]KAJ26741
MDDEGPAFLAFSGLPDENIYDFVSNVEALRKHFKWSNQVTYCYARTMLKGSARKIVQAKPNDTKSKTLGEEAVDPNSWNNLKSALVFEFSEQFAQDRDMVQLLRIRQQAGESSSEYTQRFVQMVSSLVATHPLDSNLLAMLFATGLRSEKLRWELLLRRLNTIDKAVGYVAPEQLYKVAKLTSLLSPLPTASAGELSPTSEASGSFAGSAQHLGLRAASSTFVDEADEISMREVYGELDPARGSTANGASFALDDEVQTAMPYAAAGGYWTPPRLPSTQQRRQHRQSMLAHAQPTLHGSASMSHIGTDHTWSAQSRTFTPTRFGATTLQSMELTETRYRSQSSSAGSDVDDQMRSATELNSLADQLESLSSAIRTQSDSKRRRPRLCYRCRQKGHIASDCPLPPEMAVPSQQTREKASLAKPPSRSAANLAVSWRASDNVPLQPRHSSGSPSRRYTQSWGRNHPQNF